MSEVMIQEMNKQDIDEMMEEYHRVVTTLGFITIEAYEDFKYHAVEGLIRFGGSFASNLGRALAHADVPNSIKLIRLFHSLMDEHAMLHKIFIAKRDAGVLDEQK